MRLEKQKKTKYIFFFKVHPKLEWSSLDYALKYSTTTHAQSGNLFLIHVVYLRLIVKQLTPFFFKLVWRLSESNIIPGIDGMKERRHWANLFILVLCSHSLSHNLLGTLWGTRTNENRFTAFRLWPMTSETESHADTHTLFEF